MQNIFLSSFYFGYQLILVQNMLKLIIFSYLTDNTFNFLRSILPYGILIYLLAFTKKNNLKADYFFIFFALYGFLQILGLIYQLENLYEHYWVVCLFSVLLFYNLLINKKNTELVNFVLCSNIFLISTVFLVFIFYF